MRFGSILLLAVGLAMDATAVSAARGLATPTVRPRHLLLVAGFFGGQFSNQPNVNHLVVVNGAGQIGSALVTNGWTASITGLLNVGDVFTMPGVFAINPKNRQSTGSCRTSW